MIIHPTIYNIINELLVCRYWITCLYIFVVFLLDVLSTSFSSLYLHIMCITEIILLCCIYAALMGQSGAPSHSATGGRYTPKVPDNGNIHSYHPQNGALEHNKSSKSLTNDAWRTWSLDKGGFSDFQGHMTNFLPYCIPFV